MCVLGRNWVIISQGENMKSLKEQIEIMTAYLAGKIVETRMLIHETSPVTVGWYEFKPYDSSSKGELTFDWVNRDYRIKKEEIEITRWVTVYSRIPGGEIEVGGVYESKERAEQAASTNSKYLRYLGAFEMKGTLVI